MLKENQLYSYESTGTVANRQT